MIGEREIFFCAVVDGLYVALREQIRADASQNIERGIFGSNFSLFWLSLSLSLLK